MSTFTIIVGLATGMLALQAVQSTSKSGTELSPSDLAGGYTIVAGEKFGVKEPEERIKGSTVRFTEDRVVVTDKDKNEVYGASYKLEAGAKACRIVMTSKLADNEGQVAHGLIEKKGDTIRLIYALPGGEEPTEFRTKDKQLMFELKNFNK
ncbi:MAG: TIGR03067 domain-containing protein [Isosphaeraceae bacterium]